MLIERMDKRDEIIAKCIKDMQLTTDQYVKLTELSILFKLVINLFTLWNTKIDGIRYNTIY